MYGVKIEPNRRLLELNSRLERAMRSLIRMQIHTALGLPSNGSIGRNLPTTLFKGLS